MSEFVLEIRDGAEFDFTLPAPIEMTLDQGRGPQGPAGVDASKIGDVSDLTTDDKTSLVSAINELNMEGVSLVAIYHNAKAG